jgi:hypothetical protein
MPDQPEHSALEATWSNWWGSPQLFATVASAIEKSLADGGGTQPTASISLVSADGYEQSFDGAADFISAHPPDHLGSFRQLAAKAGSGGCEVTFELNREQRLWSSDGEAMLRVVTADRDAAKRTTEKLLPVAASGYKSFWGPCSIPGDLGPKGIRRRLHLARTALNAAVAAILGAALYLATAKYEIPGLALVALLIGLAVPTGIDRVVPEIDIAPGGRTRFRAIVNRLSLAVLAVVGTWFVSLFTG